MHAMTITTLPQPYTLHMLQVASIATKPPVQQQTAAAALKQEDEDEAAASAVCRVEADGSQAAKRQKTSAYDSDDSERPQQSREEAHMVAAATKKALGLTGTACQEAQPKKHKCLYDAYLSLAMCTSKVKQLPA